MAMRLAERRDVRGRAILFVGSLLAAFGALPAPAAAKSVGLVLTLWDNAFPDVKNVAEECPDGLQLPEKQQWLALDENEREKLNEQFGFRWNRGPNGENGISAPARIKDPLPFRELTYSFSAGFNLDGTSDGNATAKTCKHRKFAEPETGIPVDHQMYRVLGCAQGQRTNQFKREYNAREFQSNPGNRILIEIDEVDDERNDERVVVRIFKGFDGLVRDLVGAFLPGSTHRVDTRFPMLMDTRGTITDGILTTEPVEWAPFPIYWTNVVGIRHIRDMRLRLALTPDGANGVLGGYEDLEEYWNMWRRSASGEQDLSGWSGATLYHAMHRLADGYPDPKTGLCTAISTVYRIEAARAYIVRPGRDETNASSATQSARRELRGY